MQNNWQGIVRLLKPLCAPDKELWNDSAAVGTLGFAYSQLQNWQRAEAMYRRNMELEPDRAQPYYNLGYIFAQQQRWQEAIQWYNEALKRYPDYLVCLYRLAYAFYAFDKPEKSKNALLRVRTLYENNTEENYRKRNRKNYIKSLFLLARVLLIQKEYSEAYTLLREVIRLDERPYISSHFKWYQLAKALFFLKKYDEALSALKKAIHPRRPKAYVLDLQGRIYHTMGDYPKALESYRKALEQRMLDYILVDRARTYVAMGRIHRAMDDLQKALQRSEKSKHKIYLELGKIELNRERVTEAAHYFRRAIHQKLEQYKADYAEAHYMMVFCHLKAGNKEAAQNELEYAQRLNPNLEWDANLSNLLENEQPKELEDLPF